jgi:hypothetical protein
VSSPVTFISYFFNCFFLCLNLMVSSHWIAPHFLPWPVMSLTNDCEDDCLLDCCTARAVLYHLTGISGVYCLCHQTKYLPLSRCV